MSGDQSDNPAGLPNFDFTEMFRQFQLPGVDMRQLAEIATESQAKALEVIRKRIEDNLQALTSPSGNSEE